MDITLKDKNGVTLHTAKKHCREDITVRVDTQEISIIPSTEEQVKEGLFNKVIVGPMLDTSDATATAENIVKDKTAYVNGERITGTLEALDTTLFRECTRLFYENTTMTKVPFFDTSNVTKMNYMFYGCKSLTETPIFNTSKVTSMNYLFYECTSLIKAPFFDTSNVTGMKNMFYGCSALTDVPVLSASSVTGDGMQNMFNNCTSLSEESLNNILLICTTATKVLLANGKTLKFIGLTSAQATVCQGLSNYQAFLDAGWTTGY